MGLWSDMIGCAARGAKRLGPAARETAEYLRGQMREDGGFANRAGRSDLYYTAMALSALTALRQAGEAAAAAAPEDRVAENLRRFGGGEGLDLIHVSCLARSWACLGESPGRAAARKALPARVQAWRSAEGGYGPEPGSARGTLYGCFLAVGAVQDCEAAEADPDAVERCVRACRCPRGGFSSAPGAALGLATATAGAIQVLHSLDRPVEVEWGHWLRRTCFRGGGFVAHPISPEPDLLSTAVALHGLARVGLRLEEHERRECEALVLGLREASGGFRGAASDVLADCEYTLYGLLALGHLGDDVAD